MLVKRVIKPIDMIAWFSDEGIINPMRFRIKDGINEDIVIKVDKIFRRNQIKSAGKAVMVYDCQSVINKLEKLFQLRYEVEGCRWFLYKID